MLALYEIYKFRIEKQILKEINFKLTQNGTNFWYFENSKYKKKKQINGRVTFDTNHRNHFDLLTIVYRLVELD